MARSCSTAFSARFDAKSEIGAGLTAGVVLMMMGMTVVAPIGGAVRSASNDGGVFLKHRRRLVEVLNPEKVRHHSEGAQSQR